MGKDPSIPFYANDWLSSPTIMTMTPLEELAYFRMLLFCWASGKCGIPSDPERLAVLTRTDAKVCSAVVERTFKQHPNEPSLITNERLFTLWSERQEFRRKCAEAGVKSGRSRRSDTNEPSTNVERTLNSSSSSSSSSSIKPPKPPKGDLFDARRVELPFTSDAFRSAWSMWCDHRSDLRKTLKKIGTGQQLKRLAAMGEALAIAAIEHSVANQYSGIYEPPTSAIANPQPIPQPPQPKRKLYIAGVDRPEGRGVN